MIKRELYEILDECLDKMCSGESIEDCLRHYPQYANELEWLIDNIYDWLLQNKPDNQNLEVLQLQVLMKLLPN